MSTAGSHLKRHRRAVGSIIGGIFVLLILAMGYTMYMFGNQSINAEQQIINNMRTFDIERSQETFRTVSGPTLDLGNQKLDIVLQNVGPLPSTITNIGVWNGIKWSYSSFHVLINSGESHAFTVTVPGIQEDQPNWTYMVQFITARGNLYCVGYPNS